MEEKGNFWAAVKIQTPEAAGILGNISVSTGGA
jgi:hypothetical protein